MFGIYNCCIVFVSVFWYDFWIGVCQSEDDGVFGYGFDICCGEQVVYIYVDEYISIDDSVFY